MSDTTDPSTDEIPPDTSPKAADRIRALSAERAALQRQLDAVGPQLAAVTATQAELAAARREAQDLAAAHAQAVASWESERAILGAGITDPEAADFVSHAWSRLPVEGRPSLGEWLANRDALPRGVRVYLADPPGPPPAPPAPRANAGASAPPPANPLTRLPHEMPPAEYAKIRAAHLAALK